MRKVNLSRLTDFFLEAAGGLAMIACLAIVGTAIFFGAAFAQAGGPAPLGVDGLDITSPVFLAGGGTAALVGGFLVHFLRTNFRMHERVVQALPILIPGVYIGIGFAFNALMGWGFTAGEIVTGGFAVGIAAVYGHNVVKHTPKAITGAILVLVLAGSSGCAQLSKAYDFYERVAPHVNVDVPGLIGVFLGPRPSPENETDKPTDNGPTGEPEPEAATDEGDNSSPAQPGPASPGDTGTETTFAGQ